MAHRLGKQPVIARYFVERRHQQRVVDAIDAEDERAFDPGDRHVEVVVGAKRDLPRRAALRRVGVDVVELLEAGWIFQFAVRRYAVPPRRLCCLRTGRGSSRRAARARDVASVSRVDLRRDRRFTGRSNEIQLSRVGKIVCRLVAAWHSVHDFAYALQA